MGTSGNASRHAWISPMTSSRMFFSQRPADRREAGRGATAGQGARHPLAVAGAVRPALAVAQPANRFKASPFSGLYNERAALEAVMTADPSACSVETPNRPPANSRRSSCAIAGPDANNAAIASVPTRRNLRFTAP
jgi:hypothetical protein